MTTLRTQLDRLRRQLEPEEPTQFCVHFDDGTPLSACRCQPASPTIKLRWSDAPDENREE
jgi:hypothetical protein